MNLEFPKIIELSNYKSQSQRIRLLTETWLKTEMYCPACGFDYLDKYPNNHKFADFFCNKCGEIYELKSKKHNIGSNIPDGAYYTALERITSNQNPNLFVLAYEKNIVENLTIVPKYFFTFDILRKRNALSSRARRAGYIGSVILYKNIPKQGKISVIKSFVEQDKNMVMKEYAQTANLKVEKLNLRGWLMDILKCVDAINKEIFSVKDLYSFIPELAKKHPDNHNIDAKIRQQLQFLRDKGLIKSLNNGIYQKILIN